MTVIGYDFSQLLAASLIENVAVYTPTALFKGILIDMFCKVPVGVVNAENVANPPFDAVKSASSKTILY